MDNALIFGRGNYCKNKLSKLREEYNVIGFLDSVVSKKEYDYELDNYVYPVNEVMNFQNCKIICMSIHFCDMYNQLRLLGVDSNRIHVGINFLPLNSDFEKETFGNGEYIDVKENGIFYITPDYGEYLFSNIDELKGIVRKVVSYRNADVKNITSLGVEPVNRMFAGGRGKAVDRYYIEDFLYKNKDKIKNTVMEIANDTYIKMFGEKNVSKEIILHVKGWGKNAIKGNFETGEGIKDNMVDCLICTQTLQYIFDLKSAVQNIYRMIKPGGYLLLTVPGIKSLCTYDDDNWGEKWSFTEKSIRQLFEPVFGRDNCEINTYGNVKIATAYMYGICYEELKEEDFSYNDKQFPFIITAAIRKI